MAGIDLVMDRKSLQAFPSQERRGAQVCRFAMERGVWLRPLGDTIVIMPPLAISAELLTTILYAVEYGVEKFAQ